MTDSHYKLLRLLDQDPSLSQRQLSRALGISLGKTNYCLKALIEKGWIKANNFRRSENKLGYAYLLTPEGIEQKARLTRQFLKRKMEEYEELRQEIRQLKREAFRLDSSTGDPK